MLGAVPTDDVRVAGQRRKCLFREAYYPQATVCEIIEEQALLDAALADVDDRTAYFLEPTASLPTDANDQDDVEAARRRVEPSARLRNTHKVRLLDYWAQCSSCQKWRIVDFSTYVTARRAMSIFQCANGDCDAPQTEEELAGLADAKL